MRTTINHKNFIVFFVCLFILLLCNTILANEDLNSIQQTERFPFKPGDAIKINTFPDTTSFLHENIFTIDDQGFVKLPIVNKVDISKMTAEEFSAFLKANYKSYVRSSTITVEPMVRISMLGGFVRAGLYYVDINNSLWDVIRLTGGPLMEDGVYNMRWERDGHKQKGDITKFFESGISLKRMGFQSGDQIWTPRPDADNFWDRVNSLMPFLTLATTITLAYFTYQQNLLYFERLR